MLGDMLPHTDEYNEANSWWWICASIEIDVNILW